MPVNLILIHGRGQQNKDAGALKIEWLDALRAGADRAGLELDIPEDRVRFLYYGQHLGDVLAGRDDPTGVVVRDAHGKHRSGRLLDSSTLASTGATGGSSSLLMVAALRLAKELGEESHDLASLQDSGEPVTRAPEWVQRILRLADSKLPYVSEATIRILFKDVQRYVADEEFKRALITTAVDLLDELDGPVVVVSHSLGTVVAHDLLNQERCASWVVPLWVTLGAPLRIAHIEKSLGGLRFPACVTHWMNAYDERDVIALRQVAFSPPNEKCFSELNSVRNRTSNHHGIDGYLADPNVAAAIGGELGWCKTR